MSSQQQQTYKHMIITLDENTYQIVKELKRRGHSISALIRYLLQEYYNQLVNKK
jgi:predicted CopG family antitoxin